MPKLKAPVSADEIIEAVKRILSSSPYHKS